MRLIHASGRFDRLVHTRRRAAREQRTSTTLITRTEATAGTVQRSRRWGVLRRPGPGARGDCSIEHERTQWKRQAGYVTRVSGRYRLGRRCWVLIARLRRHDGHLLTVITAHLPASVEVQLADRAANPHARLDAQGSAWLEAVTGLRTIIENERGERPHATLVVTADWNIDLSKQWARRMLQRELGSTVTLAAPSKPWHKMPGTHGNRVIDWAACSKHAVVTVLERTDASDHRPIQVTW